MPVPSRPASLWCAPAGWRARRPRRGDTSRARRHARCPPQAAGGHCSDAGVGRGTSPRPRRRPCPSVTHDCCAAPHGSIAPPPAYQNGSLWAPFATGVIARPEVPPAMKVQKLSAPIVSAPKCPPAERISPREFARRDGCDEKQVRRAIAKGALFRDSSGLLDAAGVGTAWRKRYRTSRTRMAGEGADPACGHPACYALCPHEVSAPTGAADTSCVDPARCIASLLRSAGTMLHHAAQLLDLKAG